MIDEKDLDKGDDDPKASRRVRNALLKIVPNRFKKKVKRGVSVKVSYLI